MTVPARCERTGAPEDEILAQSNLGRRGGCTLEMVLDLRPACARRCLLAQSSAQHITDRRVGRQLHHFGAALVEIALLLHNCDEWIAAINESEQSNNFFFVDGQMIR